MNGIEKRIVYILRSQSEPLRHYVGITNDVRNRVEWHNRSLMGHTVMHRPWSLVVSSSSPARVRQFGLRSI